jgi:membrane protein DedA with SNARE-associated domain
VWLIEAIDAVGRLSSVVQALGYLGVTLIIAVEDLIPPLPSEIVLPLVGFLSSAAGMNVVGVVTAATIGSLIAAIGIYSAARSLGEERLREFVRSHGKWIFLRERDLDRAMDWFDKHGAKAVLFGRMVPVARSFVSVPPGFARMPLWQFAGCTLLGAAIWNSVLIGLGWWLGHNWALVKEYGRFAGYGMLVLVAAVVTWFIWHRWRERVEG